MKEKYMQASLDQGAFSHCEAIVSPLEIDEETLMHDAYMLVARRHNGEPEILEKDDRDLPAAFHSLDELARTAIRIGFRELYADLVFYEDSLPSLYDLINKVGSKKPDQLS